jgi:hypothetical protein
VTSKDSTAETVACGAGTGDWGVATRIDTLRDCEIGSNSSTLAVRVQPELQGSRAIFGVACVRDRGCSGSLALASATGESYGTGEFNDLPHGADIFTPVEVDLTPAGRRALEDGALIVLTYGTAEGGFRAFMQAQ